MTLNRNAIIKTLCAVMVLVGAAMLLPAFVSLFYNERNSFFCFLSCCVPMIAAGLLLIKFIPIADNAELRMKDGFFIVGTAWVLMSVLGALPFVISGSIPNFADAFFETASGFSTTGSTILNNIEELPKGMLFWRSFTHWLGGMGVLVLTIAILPMLGIGGQKIMRAETTGPTMDKLSFTITDSAKILYAIYGGFTLAEILLLRAGGMSIFESAVNSFGTLGTGGLATHAESIAFYDNVYFEMVIAVFMMFAGINFSLYYYLFTGKPRLMFRDTEFRTYIGIVVGATAFMVLMLVVSGTYGSIGEALRYAYFQVCSIITTTGYGTADFDMWPIPCKMVILLLMFMGGSAGSTAGGLKVIRIIMLFKLIKRRIDKALHPKAVKPVRIGGKNVDEDVLTNVVCLTLLYILITVVSTVIIGFEGQGFLTSFSSVIACISNIGPGFDMVGPSLNFSLFSGFSKIYLGLVMIAGRLELYTLVLLFTRRFWERKL